MPGKGKKLAAKKLCVCCHQIVSARTEYRHRQLYAPPRIAANSPYQSLVRTGQPRERTHRNTEAERAVEASLPETYPDTAGVSDLTDDEQDIQALDTMDTLVSNVYKHWAPAEYPDDSESEEDIPGGIEDMDEVEEIEELPDEVDSETDIFDHLVESLEVELAGIGERISLMYFSYKLMVIRRRLERKRQAHTPGLRVQNQNPSVGRCI